MRKMRKITAQIVCILLLLQTVFIPGLFTFSASAAAVAETEYSLSEYMKEIREEFYQLPDGTGKINDVVTSSPWSFQYREVTDVLPTSNMEIDMVSTKAWTHFTPTGYSWSDGSSYNAGSLPGTGSTYNTTYMTGFQLGKGLLQVGCFTLPQNPNDPDHWMTVNPYRTATMSTEMGIAFMAPYTGTYTFVTGSGDNEWWKPVLGDGNGNGQPDNNGTHVNLGVRITVNNQLVWNDFAGGISTTRAYNYFTDESYAAMPNNKTFQLKAGDLLRVEFVSFDEDGYKWYRSIYSNFKMELTTPGEDSIVTSYPLTDYTDAVFDVRKWVSGDDANGHKYDMKNEPISSSPWRVVHKNGENGSWTEVRPGVDENYLKEFRETDRTHYVTPASYNPTSWPNFGFRDKEAGDKAINIIAPYRDGGVYHEMGYQFTAGATGKYHLGNLSYDDIRSVTECNYFRPLYETNPHRAEVKNLTFGLRVTINGTSVYDVEFDRNHPAIVPELDMQLKNGDVVRLEFRSLTIGGYAQYGRISGSVRMDYVEPSVYGDYETLYKFTDYEKELEAHRFAELGSATGDLNFNSDFVTTTPWSVQQKETENAGWVDYPPQSVSIHEHDTSIVYVNDDTNGSLDYPLFAYIKPLTGETFAVDYHSLIAPTNVKINNKTLTHQMAYCFTAPESGTYGFGPSVGDEQFAMYDLKTTQQCGVRITVNNMQYWPNTHYTGAVSGNWAVITKDAPVDIPKLMNVGLQKGDVLRVEFAALSEAEFAYYNRICGTVEVALREKDFSGDSAKNFEIYSHFADIQQSFKQGTQILSSSPWSIQSKIMTKAAGADTFSTSQDWYRFGTNYHFADKTTYYVTDQNAAGGVYYPGFNFVYPDDFEADRNDVRWAAVSPIRANDNGTITRTDVAYVFTAPVDGEYELKPANADKMQNSTPKNKFAQHEAYGENEKSGVRITVNGRIIWNGGSDATRDSEGFALFGAQENGIVIPTLNSIGLKKDDVLRIEFTNHGLGRVYQSRIYGLADVALKTPNTSNVYSSVNYSNSLASNYSKNGTDAATAATHNTMLVASSGSAWSAAWYGLQNLEDAYTGTKYTGATKTWNEFTHLSTDGWGIYAQKTTDSEYPAIRAESSEYICLYTNADTEKVAHVFTAPKSGIYTFDSHKEEENDLYWNTLSRISHFIAKDNDADIRIVKDGVTLWPTAGGWYHLSKDAAVDIEPIYNIAMEKGDTLRVEVRSEANATVWGAPKMTWTGNVTVQNAPLKNYDALKTSFDATAKADANDVLHTGTNAVFNNVPIDTDARFSLWGATKDGTVNIKFAGKYQLALGNGTYKLTSLNDKSVEIDFDEPMLGFDGRYDLAISAAKIMNGSTRIGTRYTVLLNGEEKRFDVADTTTAATTIEIQNSGKTALTFKNAPITVHQSQGNNIEALNLGINADTLDRTATAYPQGKFWTVKETDYGSALGLLDKQLNRYIRAYETLTSPCGTGVFDDFTFTTKMYIGDLERGTGNWWYGGEIVVREELQIGFHRNNISIYAGADEHANIFPYSTISVANLGYTHDEWQNKWHDVRVACMDDGFVVYLDGREVYYYDGITYRVNGNVMGEVPGAEKYVNHKVGKIYLRSESGNALFAQNTLIADTTPNTEVSSRPTDSSVNKPSAGSEIHDNVFENAQVSGTVDLGLFGWANSNWKAEYRNTASDMKWTAGKLMENAANFYPQEATADQTVNGGSWADENVLWPGVEIGAGVKLHARKTDTADADERAAVTFTVPALSTYSITCPIIESRNATNYMVVTLNGKQIWPANGEPYVGTDTSQYTEFEELVLELDKNDVVRFEGWSDGSSANAYLMLAPSIKLVADLAYDYYGTSVSLIQPYGTAADASLGLNMYYTVKGNANTELYYSDYNGDTNEQLAPTPVKQTEDETTYKYQLPLTATRMSEKFKFYYVQDGKKVAMVTTSIEDYAYKILEEDSTWAYWSVGENYDEDLVNDPYDTRTVKTGEHESGKYPVSLKATLAAMLEYGRIAQIYYRVNSTCTHPGWDICPGDKGLDENGIPYHHGDYPTDRLEEFISYDTQKISRDYHDSIAELRENLHVWSQEGNQYIGTAPKDGANNYEVLGDTPKGDDTNPIYLYGTSLVLTSNISLKVYLKGDWTGNETVLVTSANENVRCNIDSDPKPYSGNIKSITISGLSVADLDARFTIIVMGPGGVKSREIKVSPMGYISRVLDTYNYDGEEGTGGHGVSNNLRDLLLRLTDFHIKSKRYFEVWQKISSYETAQAAIAAAEA